MNRRKRIIAQQIKNLVPFIFCSVLLLGEASGQTFSVIHNFTGQDGANPYAGLIMDRAGNLYGTTFAGGGTPCIPVLGQHGCGTVFQISNRGGGWVLNSLYAFAAGNDGALPALGTLTLAPDGTLFGTTIAGGVANCNSDGVDGCGTVFHLDPPSHAVCGPVLCPWTETVLYRFTNQGDGYQPWGGPTLDQSGNLYGPADSYPSCGNIYKLMPSGGSWIHSIAYQFGCPPDGQIPIGEVTFDTAGNLWGTTWDGGIYGEGTLFRLSPSGRGWTESVIHSFQDSEGSHPESAVIFDSLGNIYGATPYAGSGGSGIVYELSPSGGSWTFNPLYSFTGPNECGAFNKLVMDGSGNLYGTTNCDRNGYGSVFKLSRSGNGWTYTSLHDFTGGSDGGYPYSNVVIDGNGNLYGTAFGGGTGCDGNGGCGVVWEITP